MLPVDLEVQYKDLRQTRTPALSYCRKLVKEGFPEGSRLFVYRGEVLVLKLDIHKAAKLTILENEHIGPIFKKYEDPSIRLNGARTM